MNGSNQKRLPNKLAKLVTTRSSQGGTPKKRRSSKFHKSTKTHLCRSLFLTKLEATDLQLCRLQHGCIPVNFEKTLRTPSFTTKCNFIVLSQVNEFH